MTKVLFVDDEPTIRLTLPKILEMHEFEVKAAANVQDALTLMQHEKFDVLLSDLNIGAPSDGFTVVSAMRRVQPEAVTIIITGYPAFESALQAIREQVDDYISKPANVDDLIQTIKEKVKNRTRHVLEPLRHTSNVLRNNRDQIIEKYVAGMRRGSFPVDGLNEDEVRNNVPKILDEVIRDLVERNSDQIQGSTEAAREHGQLRRRQGFTVIHLIEETRMLRNIISETIEKNLLTLNTSALMPDMVRIGNSLDARLREATASYLKTKKLTERRSADGAVTKRRLRAS